MGESFWGTKRLKSPEEYEFGAVVDEKTNVFTLGALFFHFFGSYSKNEISQMYKYNKFIPCKIECWDLNNELYDIAIKAVNEDRQMRFNSVLDFYKVWSHSINAKI